MDIAGPRLQTNAKTRQPYPDGSETDCPWVDPAKEGYDSGRCV